MSKTTTKKTILGKFAASGGFTRHVITVAGGVATAQAITVICSPIITRLYSPSDFGLLATFMSLFGILGVLTTLRYEYAIPVVKDDESAFHILVLCLMLTIAMALLVSLTIPLFGAPLAHVITHDGRLLNYIWFLPIGLLGFGFYTTLNYWIIRSRAFRTLTVSKVFQSASSVVMQIGLGLGRLGALGLILGYIASQTCGIETLARSAWRDARELMPSVSLRRVWSIAREYYRYPLFTTWGSLLNTASVQVPVLLLSAGFGAAVTGYYSLGLRILQMPMIMLSNSVAQVYLSRAEEAVREKRLDVLTEKVIERLMTVSLFFFLAFALVAPHLFGIIFGKPWVRAGEYARLLTPWLFIVFVGSPISTLIFVLERQSTDMWFQLVMLAGRSLALGIGIFLHSETMALILFSSASLALWTVYLHWLLRIANVRMGFVYRVTAREVAVALLLLTPSLAAVFLRADFGILASSVGVASVLAGWRAVRMWRHQAA